MKCRSVAGIWSGTPPLHQVTAATSLNDPPTLYTGGSDGSIIWWNLSDSSSAPVILILPPSSSLSSFSFLVLFCFRFLKLSRRWQYELEKEIRSVAMLCGHTAPIADLGICHPISPSRDTEVENSDGLVLRSSFDGSGALISACTDGLLCVWSRSSGHCRRRRRLAPWVGSPSMIRTLPSSPRYVCVGCCFLDNAQLFDLHFAGSVEESDILVDGDSQYKRPSKCAVVIVDSYTLNIVETVFHENLPTGPFRFMDVVSSGEEKGTHSVLMGNSFGKIQSLPLMKDSHLKGDDKTASQKGSSLSEIYIWENGMGEKGHIVALAVHRDIIVYVFRDHCIFRLLGAVMTVGEISFLDNGLFSEVDAYQSYVIGATFLDDGNNSVVGSTDKVNELYSGKFSVWNSRGSAIVYAISYVNEIFNSKPLFEIPAAASQIDLRSSISFLQVGNFLLRVGSICLDSRKPLLCQPFITIWSGHQKYNNQAKCNESCRMLGEGISFTDWGSNYSSDIVFESLMNVKQKNVSEQRHNQTPCSETVNCISVDHSFYGFVSKEQTVTSSIVMSENLHAPYAVVYGYASGDIEVVHFNLFRGLYSPSGNLSLDKGSHLSRKSFSGHKGAILCLAAHWMPGDAKGRGFNKVLISGSMDCTIHIWDLDNGELITVLHHHVAPVRQIILAPTCTERPWTECFLSVGEDSCVALVSLETLRVERMFPAHLACPARVVWDGSRGYIACLSHDHSRTSESIDVLYIWDIKTGARERVLHGAASHSMFDHFCKGISVNSASGSILNRNTSVSSLLLPISEDGNLSGSEINNFDKGATLLNTTDPSMSLPIGTSESSRKAFSSSQPLLQGRKQPIKCFCLYPGIAALSFDLAAIVNPFPKDSLVKDPKQGNTNMKKERSEAHNSHQMTVVDGHNGDKKSQGVEECDWTSSLEQYLIGFSLSFLHFWHVDHEVDKILVTDMKLKKPDGFIISAGIQGDKGSVTLAFPDFHATLELLKTSSEFSAMRSLTMVSLAQHMISLIHSSSTASSALAAFYTRNFVERFPQIKAPLLQLLVSFWQDESEHVRMAARSLFHCAASRAIPLPLCSQQVTQHAKHVRDLTGIEENELGTSRNLGTPAAEQHSECYLSEDTLQGEEPKLLEWLESYEMQDWISCVGGTSQDAMTSHIIVAAALAIWYPSLVKPSLASVVVHPLVKLVMAMNDKYSPTAAELLAEGMESTWKSCICSEIPHLIADIFFQIECVSGPPANSVGRNSAVPVTIRETLVGTLLPSLAMADIMAFLNVIESQIWSTASDSPVHTVSLVTLIRVVHFSPRSLAQYIDKVVNFILQTMDPTNMVMRKTCIQTSLAALKEVTRAFPMVALNDSSTKLAVGDALGEMRNASIWVYDIQSVTKIKVLDASGPPGLPSLLPGSTELEVTTLISALSFSPDGEGLVAFSEHGLMIRWWSLGSAWWGKLSRNLAPVQCTKLIFVPPWEGFSPSTSRNSIIASVMGHENEENFQVTPKTPSDADGRRNSLHSLDLSYRLNWTEARKVILTRHGVELGCFLL